MSFVIEQQPDATSYSSMVKDFILSTNANVTFELKLDGTVLVSEIYTPDAEGKIHIRNIGDICRDYLPGDVMIGDGVQHNIYKSFDAVFNSGAPISFVVQRCDAYIKAPRIVLSSGKNSRITYEEGIEVITTYMNQPLKVAALKLIGNVITPLETTILFTPSGGAIYSVNISFWKINDLLNWNINDWIGYRIFNTEFVIDYMIDFADYPLENHFLYKNVFGVPETITLIPDIKQKVAVTSESGVFNNIKRRFNIKHTDPIEVNIGALRTEDEYIRLREMFGSEETFLWVDDEWLPIVISDIKDENSPLLGMISPISFTYQFANYKHAIRL
ncbi:MAG: hypothetical protein PHV20_12220 [Bacteroidales bacterium]|nr:hypothetical protein [Bacteroidales bacterium]